MAEQGDAYSAFIEAELKNERDRRTSLDARGLAIVTTSSGIITLIFALSALVTGPDFKISDAGRNWLISSLVGFILSGVVGIAANANMFGYRVASIDTLRKMLTEHWKDSEPSAKNVSSTLHVQTLQSLRRGNDTKVYILTLGLSLQAVAITLLAVAILIELI